MIAVVVIVAIVTSIDWFRVYFRLRNIIRVDFSELYLALD